MAEASGTGQGQRSGNDVEAIAPEELVGGLADQLAVDVDVRAHLDPVKDEHVRDRAGLRRGELVRGHREGRDVAPRVAVPERGVLKVELVERVLR